MEPFRKPYPSDVSDEEWALVAPYLTLLPEDAGQRTHKLREVFNGLRYLVRYGVAWHAMPHDLPPWHAVYDQAQRWLRAGCFEMLAHDLRATARGERARRGTVCGGAARCAARRRVARARDGTDTSARAVPSSTWQWTHSATCWRCM